MAAAVALAALALATHPLWLAPLVRQLVLHRTGRTIDCAALRIGLDDRWQPRVSFDDLRIDNAPWAASREPMIVARRAVFEFDWQGVSGGVWQVRRLLLEDAAIDLERRADGSRNSRLWRADGAGPSRVRLLRVDAQRSSLRLVDAVTGLTLRIAATPLDSPRALPGRPELRLTRRLEFDGERRGVAFAGSAEVGDVVTLQRTGELVPLQGEVRIDHVVLGVVGQVGDVLAQSRYETDLHLAITPQAGPRAAPFGAVPPALALTGSGRLSRTADHWAVSAMELRAARSAVAGTLDFQRHGGSEGRSHLTATLDAPRLDLADLRWPGAATKRLGEAASSPVAAGAAPARPASAPGSLDADLDLHVAALDAAGAALARETRLRAALAGDRLQVRLVDTVVAAGHASGEWRMDTAAAPPRSALDLRVNGLDLARLPTRGAGRRPADGHMPQGGRLDGQAVLQLNGRSAHELLASATGRVEASLRGASVPRRLEAELGLDAGGLLRSLVAGNDAVPLRCAELALDLHHGVGTVRRLVLDTPRTAVSGSGSVDLVGRRLDLVLSPSSNVGALLTLPRDIRIVGAFARPALSLQARGRAGPPARCGNG